MNFSLDIFTELNDLKKSYSCEICKNVLQMPITLKTCNHELCKNCLNKNQRCPVCKHPYNERDIDENSFTEMVVKGIKSIEDIVSGNLKSEDDIPSFKICIANVAMKRNSKGETPLHTACKQGKLNKVEELIKSGVDLNIPDYANWTPLHEAIESNNFDCVKLLLKNGALPDVPGDLYTTPLHKSVINDNVKIAQSLLNYGAGTTQLDYNGKTALDLTISSKMYNLLENFNKSNWTPTCYISSTAVIYSSDVSKQDKDKMITCKAKFVSHQDFQNKNDVTHLVVADKQKLNIDILMGILKGVFIVDNKWIEEFLKTQNVISFQFIVDSFRKVVKKSVTNKMKQLPKLFDGISFNVIDHDKPIEIYEMNISKNDLIALIRAGGGKIVIRPPALRTVEGSCYYPFHVEKNSALRMCSNYIIYNEYDSPELLYKMKELRHKTSRWLIDCILNFKIQG